jgi:DNA polymerase-4
MENSPRRILHVDCDMFFVQVAQLEDPEGVGRERLLMVGGRPEGRGVVTSASYEVRAFGVHAGMPTARALRLCPRAVLVPVPRAACGRRSREVRAVLERFTPVVEAASIDEFYLDLTGTERLYADEPLETTAARVQRAVWEEAGIRVSVGGATQRMLAKLATGLAKPNGVHVVPAGSEAEFVRGFRLAELPGVGPVLAEKLERRGLRTVRDSLSLDRASLCQWLGEARGAWLHDRIRGIDPTPVTARSETKSVSHERTFAVDVLDLPTLEGHLLRLVVELAAELRRKDLRARTVRVYLRDRDFRDRQHGYTVEEAVESDRAIHRLALPLLRELWRERAVGVRLLGVGVSTLVSRDRPEQMRLLDTAPPPETERDRRLARAADALRARFGSSAVVPGGVLRDH